MREGKERIRGEAGKTCMMKGRAGGNEERRVRGEAGKTCLMKGRAGGTEERRIRGEAGKREGGKERINRARIQS